MAALPCSGDPAMVAPAARRAVTRFGALVLAAALTLGACGVGRSNGDADEPSGDPAIDQLAEGREALFGGVTWDRIDEQLRQRSSDAGLPTVALVIGDGEGDGTTTTTYGVGEVDGTAEVALAETSFWLTAAVLLTLVDDGTLTLDAPIGTVIPDLEGPVATITLRQLLSHTSGLPATVACTVPEAAACDAAVATATLVDPPGEAFHVTDLDAHLAARLAEAATGQPWSDLVAERITGPVGMGATAFADPSATGGLRAVDGTTTVDDLGRFLSMIRDDGRVGAETVVQPASVEAMLLDQTVRLDTHAEPWVAETGVPTYGLGVWRDRLRGDDVASVVSAPNRYGLYPFVDDGRSAWGIVVVDDRTHPRAEVVGASALIAQLSAAALRGSPD